MLPVDCRKAVQDRRPPTSQQDLTARMKGISLGSGSVGTGHRHPSPANPGYGYASAQPVSHHPLSYYPTAQTATAPRPQNPGRTKSAYGPTDAELAAAQRLLAALEKAGRIPPFRPRVIGKWIQDAPFKSSTQYSSGAASQQYSFGKRNSSSAPSGQKKAPTLDR